MAMAGAERSHAAARPPRRASAAAAPRPSRAGLRHGRSGRQGQAPARARAMDATTHVRSRGEVEVHREADSPP